MNGKLIVFEGTDGSGKSTQFKLLCERLLAKGTSFQRLVFPQYEEPSSALIRMYLGGEFGSHPSDVNAYAASTFYAVDRYAAWKKVWGKEYAAGGLILSDRYTTSNAVHQGGKLPPEEQPAFFNWLFDLEYRKLGLPQPDAVIYLDMPTEESVRLLRSRETATHTKGDIHEVDTEYLALCRQTALRAAQHYGWHKVSCVDQQGQVRSIEDLHQVICTLLSEYVPALQL
jgi:dTMP kinase